MRKETTKKFKINILDIIVILLAVACIVSIVLRSVAVKDSYKEKEYRLYFQIDDIRSSSFAFFEGHEGESVRIKSNGALVGTLGSEFSRNASIVTYTDDEGNGSQQDALDSSGDLPSSQERCSISGYIVLSGEMTKDGFLIEGGILLLPNQVIEVVTEHIETVIKIINIEAK